LKKIIMIGLVVLVLMSFGCVKVQQSSEIFEIADIIMKGNPEELPSGKIVILPRPIYLYTNSSGKEVDVKQEWFINGVRVEITGFGALKMVTEPTREEAYYSLRHELPAGTKEAIISGKFTALYPDGPITTSFKEKKFPITF